MKKVSKIIIMIILIILVVVTIFFLNKKQDKKIYQEEKKENKFLTLMLEKEAGTGEYEESSSTFPKEKYFFNEKLSKCENGSKIKYNEKDKTIDVYTNKTDKCYAYFDYDKLGSICRGQNMAECFVKNYKKDGAIIYHDGGADYEDMPNYELEADDFSYRYTGGNDVVNNYVCFDSNEEKCPEDNLYRIIGIFDDDADNKYNIKIIKASYANSDLLGTDGTYKANNRYYWFFYEFSEETGYKNPYWPTSELNTINLNSNYLKLLDVNKIEKHIWQISGNTEGKIIQQNAKNAYNNELGSNSLKVDIDMCADNIVNVTRKCTEEDLKYEGYIGLMYVSDYYYSALPKYWNLVGCDMPLGHKNNCLDDGGDSSKDYRSAIKDNWLSIGISEWTITGNGNSSNRYYIYEDGSIYDRGGYHPLYPNDNNFYIRPTFYLKTNIILKSGSGNKTNPYRITKSQN